MQPNTDQKNCLLTAETIKRKLRRMALQIAETNASEGAVVLAGITGNGEVLARHLAEELAGLLTVETLTVQLNKKQPLDARLHPVLALENRVVILVDDVSNTGRTLLYALKPLLDTLPKKIQTAVLVERSHKLFAVQPDFVGLSVSTTLQEHITVEIANGTITGAYLH